MTGSDAADPGPPATDLVASAGPELHRTALMLTADEDAATDLVAGVLARALRSGQTGAGPSTDATFRRLRSDLVRAYLRRAPRRPEVLVAGRSDDPGDVLGSLAPRARAASVLRLAHGWSTEETARAVRVRPGKVAALVPRPPDLDLALESVADQHALPAERVVHELRERLPAPAPAPATADELTNAARPRSGRLPRRRWPLAIVGLLLLALLVGYAVTRPDADPTAADDEAGATATPGPGRDLTEAGWELDEDGEPPRLVTGLRRTTLATVDYREPAAEVTLRGRHFEGMGFAQFAVLWCDMPPAVDDNLHPPVGTLSMGGEDITVPCAGRDGSPPVSRLVPVPLEGEGRFTVTGDLPPRGQAALAVYAEDETGQYLPFARHSGTPEPPVPAGSVTLTEQDVAPSLWGGRILTRRVEIGADSELSVFAGATGSVSVQVDGLPVTDDGDLGWFLDQLTDPDLEVVDDDVVFAPPDGVWRSQQPDVREGRWVVVDPGERRTFPLPDLLLPAPGERRTVTLSAMVEGIDDRLQVTVTDAAPAATDTGPLPLLSAGDLPVEAPTYAHGHRLLGAWRAPQDGQLRPLEGVALPDATELPTGAGLEPDDTMPAVVVVPDPDAPADNPLTEPFSPWWGVGDLGVLASEDRTAPIWAEQGPLPAQSSEEPSVPGLLEDVAGMGTTWWFSPVEGTWTDAGGLAVSLSPRPGHPDALVLAYTPVPYEEFDFAGAPPPRASWPPGTEPPEDLTTVRDAEPLLRLTEADVEDGRLTRDVRTPGSGSAVLRITTEGPGRLRLLSGGQPLDPLWASDGWWSSWTDEPVTTELPVAHPFSSATLSAFTLTVEAEGYDEGFVIEVLPGG